VQIIHTSAFVQTTARAAEHSLSTAWCGGYLSVGRDPNKDREESKMGRAEAMQT